MDFQSTILIDMWWFATSISACWEVKKPDYVQLD